MTTGSTIARFTITLSKSVAEPVQVAWNTKDGTAKAGIDYAAASGTAVFSPGETNKDVDVLVYGRAVGTEDRNFFLEMTPPPNAILGESIGECIIYLDTAGNTAVIQVIVPTGPQGAKGDSAYQSWLNLGNTGTEQDFIDSLSPPVEEIAAEVAPILDIGSSLLTAEGTETLSKPDTMTGKRLARRVAYVGAAKVATVVLADGDNLIAHAALSGDAVDFNSISLYPRILRGTVVISPEWSVEPGDKILIKSAVAGDVLHVCQYDIISERAVKNVVDPLISAALAPVGSQAFEALRRSYAEAGYNVVGTFRAGFTIVNDNDVGIDEATGKGFTGPAGPVSAGTNPASGGFVDKSSDILRSQLLVAAHTLRDARFALRDVVSVADFTGVNDSERFSKAFTYLLNTAGGGSVFVPTGTWNADIDVPTNIELVGTGEKSIIKGVTTGANSCTVKLSYSDVGVYPYGDGKIPNKNARIRNLVVDANGADFGVYMAYCLFPCISGVNVYRAKVRNLYMAAVFSYSIDTVILSGGESRGGSMGDNIFGWTGGVEGIHCNAGNARRLIAYGNGTTATYDKVTAPSGGAGFTVTGGSGNTFTAFQGEQNKGPGLYIAQNTQAEFHGIYFEANANDGTSDFRQCVNESTGAVFYDVEPRFNAKDTFHCTVHTRIFNYFGNRITGVGPVSAYGKYDAANIESPNVQTVALVERLAFDTNSGVIRMNMLKPAPRATEGFYKTGIYEMGAFVAFKSTVTVGTGGAAKTIQIRTITATVLATLTIPAGIYNSGDLIYVKFNQATIGDYSVVEMGFGGGANIATVDCGIYAKFMV